jgi:ribosomal protein L37AE/L43A
MPCPRCNSNDLWDDNLAWGCHKCKWFTTGEVRNTSAKFDRFLSHEEYKEMRKQNNEPR